MRYFKVQVKLGHLGCGKDLPSWVYIKAKNMVENAIDNCLKAIKEKEVK